MRSTAHFEDFVFVAGWSSPVARQAHNLKVVGSNPTPAPNFALTLASGGYFVAWHGAGALALFFQFLCQNSPKTLSLAS